MSEPINSQENVKANKNKSAEIAIKKLNKLEKDLNKVLINRKDVIHSMILAIVTKSHVLQYGPPGTAKSQGTRYLTEAITGANYFEWLLTKGSDISELFGPISIKAIQNDNYKRNVTGKLPEAHIAFIDEIFKCNSATLNALLSAINERVFYNDGKPVKIPLISMFAASNEIPDEGSNLEAIYDRFILRHYVDYFSNINDIAKLMNLSINNNSNNNLTSITLNELESLQFYVDKIKVPDVIISEFSKLIHELKQNGIPISERRYVSCLRLLQGNALLDKRKIVTFADFHVLCPALWRNKKDIPEINKMLKKLKDPYGEKIKSVLNEFKNLSNAIKDCFDKGNITDANNLTDILTKQSEIQELIIKAESIEAQGKAVNVNTSKLANLIGEMNSFIESTTKKMQSVNSSIDGDDDDAVLDDLGF
jgi:MoxR-like ATPase